jgi:hypothetical protein
MNSVPYVLETELLFISLQMRNYIIKMLVVLIFLRTFSLLCS